MQYHYFMNRLNRKLVSLLLVFLTALTVLFMYLSWMVQTDFGKVTVRNVKFKDYNGKIIAAKLMIPKGVSKDNPAPGIIYLHGYQNNKETNAPYCIEAARRGFVVLNVDTLGRGKSQAQINEHKRDLTPCTERKEHGNTCLNCRWSIPEDPGLWATASGQRWFMPLP